MKRQSLSCVAILAPLLSCAAGLLVGTYNLRIDCEYDELRGNGWSRRAPMVADMLEFLQPDVFGTQELMENQVADLLGLMPEYDCVGIGPHGMREGEHSPIFFNHDKLRLIDSGSFWLSETPDTVSRGWDAAFSRVCAWGVFEIRATQDTLCFFNLHLDHVGRLARINGAKLILDRMKRIAFDSNCCAKVVLTGDFNVDQNDEVYAIFETSGIVRDAYGIAERRWASNGTFNNFDSDSFTFSRIDHVFVSEALGAKRYGVLTDAYWIVDDAAERTKGVDAPGEIRFQQQDRRLPSDHYPVFVKLSM